MLTKNQLILFIKKMNNELNPKAECNFSFHNTSRGDKIVIHLIPEIAEKKNFTTRTLYWSPIRGWVDKLIDKK